MEEVGIGAFGEESQLGAPIDCDGHVCEHGSADGAGRDEQSHAAVAVAERPRVARRMEHERERRVQYREAYSCTCTSSYL